MVMDWFMRGNADRIPGTRVLCNDRLRTLEWYLSAPFTISPEHVTSTSIHLDHSHRSLGCYPPCDAQMIHFPVLLLISRSFLKPPPRRTTCRAEHDR